MKGNFKGNIKEMECEWIKGNVKGM